MTTGSAKDGRPIERCWKGHEKTLQRPGGPICPVCTRASQFRARRIACPECNGLGHHWIDKNSICPLCRGRGRIN